MKKHNFLEIFIMLNNFQILGCQISFKNLKESVISIYDQFLKDLKGNLIFQNLKIVEHGKNLSKIMFCH